MKINVPKKYRKLSVEIFRIVIGLLFVFSGFVKAVDPLGSTYKFTDYFGAFGFGFLDFAALPAAFLLSAFEFLLGLSLLCGIYRKITGFLTLLFMGFMTCLTLYLAIANPVTDCGCFGDAIIISNWQTFFKNIIILPCSILVFLWHKEITSFFSKKSRSLVFLYGLIFILGVSFYCYLYLPVLDFRPYKIGNNIKELMEIPEGAETAVYETTFIYEKEGVQQEFTLDNYPKDGSGWTFVDSKSKQIKKGYEPPIHDFIINDEDGYDITNDILANENYTFLMVAHKLEKASDSYIDKINELYDYSQRNGYDFYCLTSSLSEVIKEWTENTGAEYPFCTADDITLKTIIRSNPGLLLIKDAVILNKWSDRKIPGEKELTSPLEESSLEAVAQSNDGEKIFILSLILVIPLLLLSFADWNGRRMENKKKNRNK
ncbi:MAG: DoxX family protein [Dysgonamonadaceae bacterium]|jgi:uncharacterized membrane protein YphA (DoxX/SURF4 family)|nr:DoxX family protein [Dysgonamonadaceae bacterium]